MLRNSKGMTLLEIMIVLVILGGLIAVLGNTVTTQLKKARVKEAQIQMAEIQKQLDLFYTDCGYYPDSLDDLVAAPDRCSNWGPDPYLKSVPKDPWGTAFVYEYDGSTPVLISLGEGGRPGGSGVEKDISSEELGQ